MMILAPAPLTRPARRLLNTATPLSPFAVPLPAASRSSGRGTSDAQQVAHRMGQALVEVLRGRRPAQHLEGVTAPRVYDTVERLARGGHGASLRLVRVHAQVPAPGVVEATLALSHEGSGQTYAAALRLENRGARWVCQAIEIALAGGGVTVARGSS
ncbi:Rv3235 family protein [Nigerium massiliense]|uniref:Rv3235 family protein n=1 Tax=Nigerium massiliense TaxID=1522317 RepID=UPI0005912EF6|nr:Rv3235 family protein [Nigerium massiliense]